MTSRNYRAVIARDWMRKSERALNDAELLFGGDSLVGCVNRLYYAVFYAVSAVLAQEGREYGKHTAVRAALHRDFVKPGRVPRQCSITYNTLFDDRQEGDYTPRTSIASRLSGRNAEGSPASEPPGKGGWVAGLSVYR